MSESVTVALIMSIAPTLTVVATWLAQRRAQRKLDAKVEEVHGIVNGSKTAMEAHIEALKAEIRGLKAKPKRRRT